LWNGSKEGLEGRIMADINNLASRIDAEFVAVKAKVKQQQAARVAPDAHGKASHVVR
jgi:hypothetical protein